MSLDNVHVLLAWDLLQKMYKLFKMKNTVQHLKFLDKANMAQKNTKNKPPSTATLHTQFAQLERHISVSWQSVVQQHWEHAEATSDFPCSILWWTFLTTGIQISLYSFCFSFCDVSIASSLGRLQVFFSALNNSSDGKCSESRVNNERLELLFSTPASSFCYQLMEKESDRNKNAFNFECVGKDELQESKWWQVLPAIS